MGPKLSPSTCVALVALCTHAAPGGTEELTRTANYVCDKARQFISPSYRVEEGAVLVVGGPFEDGSQLGPFYELESSSSAKELEPGQAMEHIHKTYHFEGDFELLNMIAKAALGVDLNQIK